MIKRAAYTDEEKKQLLKEFERPKVVFFTPEEIKERLEDYRQVVASCALEDAEPSDFGKLVAIEEIKGELTENQAFYIILRKLPEETVRIENKLARLKELGLTWRDLLTASV